ATSFKEVQKPLENFNHIAWFPIDEAIKNLKRGSHKWAIESWKKQHKIG
ncbi:TPA: DNA mismatch repair protein MutT, partial [Streptococcus pneumoniae]|nr:DNA mismatch repair protein MutT [Streptococcus pneumoniae]